MYEALDTTLSRPVALKVRRMPTNAALAERGAARFLREARAAAHVRHAHVVSVFDFGIEQDLVFLAMELVDGETLAALLKRERALSIAKSLEILLPILSAAAELHAQGILHRDIKPANILLGRGDDPLPKIADFGLSRFVEEAPLSESGVIAGTPQYMAPEVMLGLREASTLSDQYALGVVLYECATGERPFQRANLYEAMHSVVAAPVCPPSSFVPQITRAFDHVVLRAMDRRPDRRFESIDALAEALLPFASKDVEARWRGAFYLSGGPAHKSGINVIDRAAAASPATTPPRIAPIACRIIHDSEGLLLAEIGVIYAAVWRQSVTKPSFELQRSGLAAVVDRHPDGAGFLCVVEETCSPMPNDELRRASGEMVASHGARLACLALVVEATGFSAAVIRGVITGMLVFVRLGSDIPVAVFSNIRDAVPWMSEFVRVDSADAFMSSLAEFRRGPPATVAHALDGQDDTTVTTLVGDAGARH